MEKMKNIITGVLSVAVLFIAFQVSVANESSTNKSTFLKKHTQSFLTDFTIQGDTLWFPVTINGLDDMDPASQQVSDQPTDQRPSGDCDPDNSGKVCSVKLDISGITDETAYNELKSRINDSTNPATIQDFLDLGATAEEYSHELAP